MHDFLVNKKAPAAPAALAAADLALANGLPTALRDLLSRANGGHAPPNTGLKVPDGTTAGAIAVLPVEKLAETTSRILGPGSPRVVWARDGSGNALTVDSDGRVFFWDHDTDRQTSFECELRDLPAQFYAVPRSEERPATKATSSPVEELLEKGARLPEFEAFLSTALSEDTSEAFLVSAVTAERLDVVGAILDAGPVAPHMLARPLHRACRRGLAETVRVLVRAGADPNRRLKEGWNTPLMSAAASGHLTVTQALVDLGADPDQKLAKNGFDAEHLARAYKHPKVAEFLGTLREEG